MVGKFVVVITVADSGAIPRASRMPSSSKMERFVIGNMQERNQVFQSKYNRIGAERGKSRSHLAIFITSHIVKKC
jgi:hypothetical protein